MAKSILFHQDARDKMLVGINKVCEAVSGTLGPKGRNAFIERPYQNLITNDGVTIANSIELEDKFENLGAHIVKNASSQTNDDAGDGTTTTAVLLKAIIDEAANSKDNPIELRESLNQAAKLAVGMLKERSRPVKDEDLFSVAFSASENEEIARLVVDLIKKLGDKSVINVEDAKTFETNCEIVNGYDAPVGFMSPYFVSDPKTGKAVFEDTPVLVSKKKIGSLIDLKRIWDIFEREGVGKCVLVVEDIDPSVLGVLAMNKVQGKFQTVVIKAHGEILDDIEGAVGATAISDEHGITFTNIMFEHLGKADKVVVDAHKSLFLGNMSGALRATELDTLAETEENEYRKKKLKDRAAKLRGGIGTLRIGAHTDYERDYLKLKAEDTIKAVQAALEEGIVEGGGLTWWAISKMMPSKTIGEQILQKALRVPFRTILENAGQDARIVEEKVKEGYNAKTGQYVNMYEAGIVDPAKVERCALENAVSAAGTFLTSFVAITENEEKK